MSRVSLFVACAALVAGLPAAGGPAPLPVDTGTRPHLVGRWAVTFANGVVETCEVRPDGTASESEPNRSAVGLTRANSDALVITFADDRVERWTVPDGRVVVEHWFPATAYPLGSRVLGVAKPARRP